MPFDPNQLTSTALFKLFWTSNEEGTSRRGLDEVTKQGVEKLAEFARKHALDGTDAPGDAQTIDEDEKAVIKAILEHNHYGTFFEQDALPLLFQKFGIDPGAVHATTDDHKTPIAAAPIELPGQVTRVPEWQLQRMPIEQLGELFDKEYSSRRDFFEGRGVSQSDKGKRILGLLRDYSRALWARGERNETETAGNKLLDAFFAKPFAATFGKTDFNGFGVGAAQALVLGQEMDAFKKKFPNAYPTADATYLSMDGQMAGAMKFVDEFRKGKGQEPAAQKFEEAPYLGYLIGEEAGHTKHGSLSETNPFGSSGVNWGKVLFPRDAEIAGLPVRAGFEFPIDCVDAYSRAIPCNPKSGDRLEVRDKQGRPVTVEKVIERDAEGKAVSWSATFKAADGTAIPPTDVVGVILDRSGRVKGDGKTTGSVNMWWYGFCDRNTAQKLYKSRYGIPQLDREMIKIKANDKIIEVPKAEAQKIIDADVPDLVTGESMSGFRFNEEPQVITLKDGRRFQGRVDERVMENAPGTSRLGGDMVSVHDAPGRKMLGSLEFTPEGGEVMRLEVADITSIEKDEASGKITVHRKEGSYPESYTGAFKKEIDFSSAERANGKLFLKQGETFPLRGEIKITLPSGEVEFIPASDINEISGEIQSDMRISQYLTWVSQQEGLFATDNSKGVVVSNGMRWVNKIELDDRPGTDRPEWSGKDALRGIQGDLKRQDGDKIVWVRARYGSSADSDISSTQFAGWMQVGADGRIINEAFTAGQPDFGWGASGKLNWKAASTFNPYADPEMRLQLLINGVSDDAKLQALADAGNLPANWKKYKVAQA